MSHNDIFCNSDKSILRLIKMIKAPCISDYKSSALLTSYNSNWYSFCFHYSNKCCVVCTHIQEKNIHPALLLITMLYIYQLQEQLEEVKKVMNMYYDL